MKDISAIADEIIAREGGFVDDPADPGGATKFGVTVHTLRRLGLDLTGDRKVDARDVRRLGKNEARDIFLEHYYRRTGIFRLPEGLQPSVFDMYVNAGNQAVKLLQRLLADMGFPTAVDGVIGPKTIKAAEAAAKAAPDHIVDAYGIARRNYYYRLADRRPASRKYAQRRDGGKGGWIQRAEAFISLRYHLTDTEHRERTHRWG